MRSRIAWCVIVSQAFNQQSQRYVKFKGGIETIKPATVAAHEEASAVFDEAIAAAVDAYHKPS